MYAVMALSLDQQLAAVETAIANAEAAQSYGLHGRMKTNASLAVLYKRRDELQDRIDRSGTPSWSVAQVDRPT